MSDSSFGSAWLFQDGERLALTSPFNIGRSSKCRHVVDNVKVSREHTLLQFDEAVRHWLVIDLGSTNGTYLNGKRINRPTVLRDGDEIGIGDARLIFHNPSTDSGQEGDATLSDQTEIAIAHKRCWLLIADIKQSTRLIQEISQAELSERLRRWARECEAIIQMSGGLINEYMGDGLLAFWQDTPDMPLRMGQVLKLFDDLQSATGLEFRVICHSGMIGIGGGMSSGLEKLAGKELNFIFKIEKSAGLTGAKITLTESAAKRLLPVVPVRELGAFSVAGFNGAHKLYAPRFETTSPEVGESP